MAELAYPLDDQAVSRRHRDFAASRSSRLEARGVSAGYDAAVVLNGVDLKIPDGQITALVGPNGCGKSTLLKVLARILKPSSGTAVLDGKDVFTAKTRDVAARLGLLPQGPATPEGLTVRELVCQGRYPHQSLLRQWTRLDEAAVSEAMATANVTEFADRPVDSISGGQRQRCWIAMVLAQQTDLILLDEPTTFLDLKVQVDLMDLLVRLAAEQGRTLVVVLHELNLAAAYADYLVMMKNGAIVAHGDVSEVFTSKHLKQVFDLDAAVIHDPLSGRPVCVPHLRTRSAATAVRA
ncbi:ABC transporter ATP-binding protein [Devosia sp. RR2S18]|uniref:ABC transporter ATP-binding protein n=1 Tax=Devosia rhizosphaerae TaxID=3049774 RepID=UPI002541755D|nr:ABC transporter ATP-binding protein [Devosia sp. RR2S18]WIJ24954.1 ABC transporter ATP-binding protein [Devosia sp. RR2S18]